MHFSALLHKEACVGQLQFFCYNIKHWNKASKTLSIYFSSFCSSIFFLFGVHVDVTVSWYLDVLEVVGQLDGVDEDDEEVEGEEDESRRSEPEALDHYSGDGRANEVAEVERRWPHA